MTTFLGLQGRLSYLNQAKPQRHHSILTYAYSIQATNLALAQKLLQTVHHKDTCIFAYPTTLHSVDNPFFYPLLLVGQQPPFSSDG